MKKIVLSVIVIISLTYSYTVLNESRLLIFIHVSESMLIVLFIMISHMYTVYVNKVSH